MNTPATLPSGSKYMALAPEDIEVEVGRSMPLLTFTDHEGDAICIMLIKRQALDLFDKLGSVLIEDMTAELMATLEAM